MLGIPSSDLEQSQSAPALSPILVQNQNTTSAPPVPPSGGVSFCHPDCGAQHSDNRHRVNDDGGATYHWSIGCAYLVGNSGYGGTRQKAVII
jgi:hypothetical protein